LQGDGKRRKTFQGEAFVSVKGVSKASLKRFVTSTAFSLNASVETRFSENAPLETPFLKRFFY